MQHLDASFQHKLEKKEMKALERRLASVLNQGFEDCATVFAAFKLIDSFEGQVT